MERTNRPRRGCYGGPPDGAQRNFTGPDSRIQPVRRSVIAGYNAQIAVDGAHQIIIAQRVQSIPADRWAWPQAAAGRRACCVWASTLRICPLMLASAANKILRIWRAAGSTPLLLGDVPGMAGQIRAAYDGGAVHVSPPWPPSSNTPEASASFFSAASKRSQTSGQAPVRTEAARPPLAAERFPCRCCKNAYPSDC